MLPSLFVPHGSPFFALDPGAAGTALRSAVQYLPRRPRAIVVVSAHWQTEHIQVGNAHDMQTLHDFWGFPEPLYDIEYPAPGEPMLAERFVTHLNDAGFAAIASPRGLDHGAWIPLRLMFPEADIPVVPLSLLAAGDTRQHYRLGATLAPVLDDDVLLVGSGNMTHNLRDVLSPKLSLGGTGSYAQEFADWFAEQLAAGDLDRLFDYRRIAPHAVRAHPGEEHLLPLFVALGATGAAGRGWRIRRLHAGVEMQALAMDSYLFERTPGAMS